MYEKLLEKVLITRLMGFKIRFRMMFLALIVLCMLGILFGYHRRPDVRYCFRHADVLTAGNSVIPTNSENFAHLQPLEDVLLAKIQPKPGKSIFFHETSCHRSQRTSMQEIFGTLTSHVNPTIPNHLLQLTARQACAVESAALHNPNLDIFVLFASPVYQESNCTSSKSTIIDAVLSYANVHMRNLNLWTYALNTPINDWLNDGDLFKSHYVLSHISDFLRYLTLWRFGGTYLDMDIVMLRTIEDVPPNYTGAESNSHLAAGVMNFAADGFGHDVATQCLDDFQLNFNGGDWGNNGPGVITRIMQKICATHTIASMLNTTRCKNFKVFPRDAFYAITWEEWEHFFEAQYLEETIERTKKSYVIHVWNKHSKHRKVKVGSNAAYGKFAAQHCPKVYAAAGEYF